MCIMETLVPEDASRSKDDVEEEHPDEVCFTNSTRLVLFCFDLSTGRFPRVEAFDAKRNKSVCFQRVNIACGHHIRPRNVPFNWD